MTQHFDPIPNQLSGRKWTSAMIDLFWRSFRRLWDIWNGQVHGVNATTRSKIQKEKAHCELLALYLLCGQTRHCDRDIFYATAKEQLSAQPVKISIRG
jgi:hypothetical protein